MVIAAAAAAGKAERKRMMAATRPWGARIGMASSIARIRRPVGAWVTTQISAGVLRWILAASFLAMAVWMLVPDKLEDDSAAQPPRWGVFATTVLMFFLAEMGDKTQIATAMLAARFDAYLAVVAGTTAGMMLANAPVVWLGERVTRLLPLTVVHRVSALIFAVLAVLAIWTPF